MFQNCLKAAIRQLRLHKTNSFINVLGLALGLASFILICAYTHFEKSFDRMHENAERIYRVESRFYNGKELVSDWPTSTNGYAKPMKETFPEIESFTRINWNNSERVVRYNDIKFREEGVCIADSNFFSFFSYPMISGDPKTALNEVNTIVISESAAKKYFGDAEPLGKVLEIRTMNRTMKCAVTGVFKDLPANSTIQFNFLISWSSSPKWVQDFWYQHESYTFLRLSPGANPAKIEAGFPAMAEKYKTGESLKDLTWAVQLVPIADMHLNPVKQYEIEVKGDRKSVDLLSILALVILGIASINYINLSTARAVERAKEVGVRKVIGAGTMQLFLQFLAEAVLVNLLAFVCAGVLVLLAVLLLPYFAGQGLSPQLLFDSSLVFYVLLIFMISVILSGIYPAFILSNFKAVTVLKGKYSFSGTRALLRKSLIVFQFAGSLIIIAWTVAIYRQVSFMQSQSTGVNIAQTLVVKAPVSTENYKEKINVLKSELAAFPEVAAVTGSGSVPGKEVKMFISNRRFGADKSEESLYEMLKVDFDFIKTYGLKIKSGRAFDSARLADSTGLVLNEAAVQKLGFANAEAAIGKKVWLETATQPSEVIGVIHNYHHQSLQQQFTPVILFMDPGFDWIPTTYFSVKIKSENMSASVEKVQALWKGLFPESSFDFFFLDDFYNSQYRQDALFGKMFLVFSVLTVFIACIGLFGLTAYSAARRTKEIGVRKVLGAPVHGIISLLTIDSVKLVLVGSLIAIPASILLILNWLENYAFRVNLIWWQLLLPVIILLFMAICTIGYITYKAAIANPVKSLRSE